MNPFGGIFISEGFEEIIVPSIWEAPTFTDKVGPENTQMMWTFRDKGERAVCLIPEVTGLIQETWRDTWSKQYKTRNIFYVQRCYRYEKPQAGRYREFTQLGIEMLGSQDTNAAKTYLQKALDVTNVEYIFENTVQRGLSYYTTLGFEAKCEKLGAQKQIAGGGNYNEGVGWAIGIDRLVLALTEDN